MTTYKLFKYGLISLEEELVYENDNIEFIVDKAIELSNENAEVVGIWTYRIDTYDGDVWIGKCRFFNNGKEITQEIINTVLGNKYKK